MKEIFDRLFSGGLAYTYLTEPFRGFGWRDALDILALMGIFFAAYLFMRDRRAGKLIGGIALMVGVYVVSGVLDLYALRYIFGSFFGYGLIALAIVFQPEIRSAMERMGSVPLRGLKTIGAERKGLLVSQASIDAIVEGVKNIAFSGQAAGALIVIERSTRIGEYIRTGTQINADISAQMLEAIFFKDAPMHDGAVIIRNGRLFAAGCYLPTTENTDLPKELGTRHRAAIGLSEQSDSVVIVVSEETSNISVACNGVLERGFHSVSLRRKLYELLRSETGHGTDSKK